MWKPAAPFVTYRGWSDCWGYEILPAIRCKHGLVHRCLPCGVTERRDALHRTRGGVGETWWKRPEPPRKVRGRRRRDAKGRDRRSTIR